MIFKKMDSIWLICVCLFIELRALYSFKMAACFCCKKSGFLVVVKAWFVGIAMFSHKLIKWKTKRRCLSTLCEHIRYCSRVFVQIGFPSCFKPDVWISQHILTIWACAVCGLNCTHVLNAVFKLDFCMC